MSAEPHTYHASVYAARRAIRTGSVDGYLRRNKKWDTPTVRRLAEIIDPMLTVHCIAKAEQLAIDQLLKERT